MANKTPASYADVKQMCKCDDCPSACCRHVQFEVCDQAWLRPTDIDNVRYMLMHSITIQLAEDRWMAVVYTKCEHQVIVKGQHRCGNYENRPQICRDHSEAACIEKDQAVYNIDAINYITFNSVAEFDNWLTNDGQDMRAGEGAASKALPKEKQKPWIRNNNPASDCNR